MLARAHTHKTNQPTTQAKNKTLWNMNVVVIPIVSGTLGTVAKDLSKRLEEIIQTTASLSSAGILRRVMEI